MSIILRWYATTSNPFLLTASLITTSLIPAAPHRHLAAATTVHCRPLHSSCRSAHDATTAHCIFHLHDTNTTISLNGTCSSTLHYPCTDGPADTATQPICEWYKPQDTAAILWLLRHFAVPLTTTRVYTPRVTANSANYTSDHTWEYDCALAFWYCNLV